VYSASLVVTFDKATTHTWQLGFVANLADAHPNMMYSVESGLRHRCTLTAFHPAVYDAVLKAAQEAQAEGHLRIVSPKAYAVAP
jgi:hypothetical protein